MPLSSHQATLESFEQFTGSWRASFLFLCLCLSTNSFAITVPEGGSIRVGDGSLAIGCTTLVVAGDVSIGEGAIDSGNVIIRPTGTVELGSGTLIVRGRLDNQGGLGTNQGGRVQFAAGCGFELPVPTLSIWALLLLFLLLFIPAVTIHFRGRNNATC